MKQTMIVNVLVVACVFTTQVVIAEVKTNADAPPDSWNGPEQRQATAKSQEKVITMNEANQMRCWQWGRLIIQVNDLQPASAQKGEFMVKGSDKLRAYDFGETFCLYLGGK